MEITPMKTKIIHLMQARDEMFVSYFCPKGTFIDDTGEHKNRVCRLLTVEEVFKLLHEYDEQILALLND